MTTETVAETSAVTVNAHELQSVLRRVTTIVAKDSTRPVLTCCRLTADLLLAGLEVAGCDDYRLTRQRVRCNDTIEHGWTALVPASEFQALVKRIGGLKRDNWKNVTLDRQGDIIRVTHQDGWVENLRVEAGNYPNLESLIPKKYQVDVMVQTTTFLALAQSMATLSRDDTGDTVFVFQPDRIEAWPMRVIEGLKEAKAAMHYAEKPKKKTPELQIAFRAKFLQDIGNVLCKAPDLVRIQLSGTYSAAMFQAGGEYLLMPVIGP